MNRDAGAARSSSHTELRPTRGSAQTIVGGDGFVNMLRGQVSVVTAVIPRQMMVMEARTAMLVTGAGVS